MCVRWNGNKTKFFVELFDGRMFFEIKHQMLTPDCFCLFFDLPHKKFSIYLKSMNKDSRVNH